MPVTNGGPRRPRLRARLAPCLTPTSIPSTARRPACQSSYRSRPTRPGRPTPSAPLDRRLARRSSSSSFLAGIGIIGALSAVSVYAALSNGLPAGLRPRRPAAAAETVFFDRTGKTELARFGEFKREVVDVRRDPADPARRDDGGRGQDVLGERGLRPGGHRRGRHRFDPRRQPRRLDDHPAARPRAPAGPRPRPGPGAHGRAQAQGDHPVDPADPGLSRTRRASARSSPPT